MQEVNRAWSVLGDPQARAAYDAELGVVRTASAAEDEDDDDDDEVFALRGRGPGTSLRRHLPLWILLGLLAAIFLFTAYAGGPPPS